MKKKIFLSLSAIALGLSALYAFQEEEPGGKFCKHNPTMDTGLCSYSATGTVAKCNTVIISIKDCYGVGED